MIRALIALIARQEGHSVTAALGLAMAAILFAQMILPGALALAFHQVRGAPPQPGVLGPAHPEPSRRTPAAFPTERPMSP